MAPTTKSGKRASLRARATAKANPNRTSFKQISEAFADDIPLTTFTPTGAIASNNNTTDTAEDDDTYAFNFNHTKRDKRIVKSSVFRSRISLSAPHGEGRGVTKDRNAKKHASRKKKSSTTLTNSLAALADALPSTTSANDDNGMNGELDEMRRKLLEGVSVSVRTTKSGNSEAAKMKTLSTKRGMVKRREKLLVNERERFGRNMAVMLEEGSVFRGGQEQQGQGQGQEVVMSDDQDAKVSSGDTAGSGASAAAGLKALRGFIQERLAVQNAIS